jgi:hypothetical protein
MFLAECLQAACDELIEAFETTPATGDAQSNGSKHNRNIARTKPIAIGT